MNNKALRDQLLHQNRPEDVRGFLTQVWESHDSLPQQSPVERRKYFLTRGLEILLALPVSSLVTTVTVAFSIALVTGFILLTSNMEELVSELGNGVSITAYLRDNIPAAEVESLRSELAAYEGVGEVVYTSKVKALADFRESLGEKGEMLSRFDSKSPLPASLELTLDSQATAVHEAIVARLKGDALVSEVLSGEDFVDRVSGLIGAIKVLGFGGGLFVFVVVGFVILNTIKLVIYAQRHEIEVMQLVGATRSTVRTPFLVAGALQGFFGAVFGIILLRIVFALLLFSLSQTKLFGSALPLPTFYSLPATLLITILGALLGTVASALAVGRHLETVVES